MIKMPLLRSGTDVASYITGHFQERGIRPDSLIVRSWQRSVAMYGLDPNQASTLDVLTSMELREQLEMQHSYLEIAKHGVVGLAKRISNLGFSVLLTDETGTTLDVESPTKSKKFAEQSGLLLGSRWSEENVGTNGIGTCLAEQESLIVHRGEHFLSVNSELSCTVSPIFDPLGNLKGCLNATCFESGVDKNQQYLTLQLVLMYSKMIENAYFRSSYRSQITIQVREVGDFHDLSNEQLLAISERGVIIGANRSAFAEYSSLLKKDQPLLGSLIENIIGLSVDELLVQTSGGALAIRKLSPLVLTEIEMSVRIPAKKSAARYGINRVSSLNKHEHPSLDKLCGMDAAVARNVKKIRRIIDKDIPILITGETGTGKEAFARAIHDSSERSSGPFVALNCAAIPESLIESELFGYSSGSFTGANRSGMKGKLKLADRGTIFLDEIGDMPLQLQTRLLRALAEREILPLGASEPIALDIQVISATHQDLKLLVNDGLFREDFYYRLNGASLHLPPLRERSDKDYVVRCVLEILLEESPDTVVLSKNVISFIDTYQWPGNIRQLSSVLRYALAVCDYNTITLDCLPSDIVNTSCLEEKFEATPSIKPITLEDFVGDEEGRRLYEALKNAKWNITIVSEQLGICRSTVYRKMKKYNILPPNEYA